MKNISLIFLSFLVCSLTYAQSNLVIEGSLKIIIKDNKIQGRISNGRVNGTLTDDFTNAIKKNKVVEIKRAYPRTKNDFLKSIYLVKFNGSHKIALNDFMGLKEKRIIDGVYEEKTPTLNYNPSDAFWNNQAPYPNTQGILNLNYLKTIQADKAWDITRGNPNVTIAVIDTDFDILHPDLANKGISNVDLFDGVQHGNCSFVSSNDCFHGTAVSVFAAGQTDGGGSLASPSFNCSLQLYNWSNHLAKAHFASLDHNVNVISIIPPQFRTES